MNVIGNFILALPEVSGVSDKGAFITGSTFLIDGGATSSYYYGPLQPDA